MARRPVRCSVAAENIAATVAIARLRLGAGNMGGHQLFQPLRYVNGPVRIVLWWAAEQLPGSQLEELPFHPDVARADKLCLQTHEFTETDSGITIQDHRHEL